MYFMLKLVGQRQAREANSQLNLMYTAAQGEGKHVRDMSKKLVKESR